MNLQSKHFTWCSEAIADGRPDGQLATLSIIRRKGEDRFEVGAFKVDTGCLGVRDAIYRVMDADELREYKEKMEKVRPLAEKSAAWGRKFVEDAVAYAQKLGFAPARDYKKAARVFGGAKAADCPDTFVFGSNGKPLYVAGPNDSQEDIDRILRMLSLKCGRGGYLYLLPVDSGKRVDYLGHVDEVWLVDEVDDLIEQAENGGENVRKRVRSRLKQLLDLHPKSPAVLYGLGALYFLEDKFNEARLLFREALEGAPKMPWALCNMSWSCLAQSRFAEAKIFAGKVLEVVSEEHELHEKAEKILSIIAKTARESGRSEEEFLEGARHLELGLDHFEKDQFVEALPYLQQAVDILPTYAPIWALTADCLDKNEDFEAALDHIDKAMELTPKNPAFFVIKKEILVNQLRCELRREAKGEHDHFIDVLDRMSVKEFCDLYSSMKEAEHARNAKESENSIDSNEERESDGRE